MAAPLYPAQSPGMGSPRSGCGIQEFDILIQYSNTNSFVLVWGTGKDARLMCVSGCPARSGKCWHGDAPWTCAELGGSPRRQAAPRGFLASFLYTLKDWRLRQSPRSALPALFIGRPCHIGVRDFRGCGRELFPGGVGAAGPSPEDPVPGGDAGDVRAPGVPGTLPPPLRRMWLRGRENRLELASPEGNSPPHLTKVKCGWRDWQAERRGHPQVFLKHRVFETSHLDQLQNFQKEAPPAPGTQGRV
ncbi:Dynamin-3 [Manis pentadactyla]|nr:Dynamin-3 [Manis pentadactyla]